MTNFFAIKNTFLHHIPTPFFPKKEEKLELKKHLIHDVAIKGLKELSIALSATFIVSLFTPTFTAGSLLIAAAISSVAVNTLIRSVAAKITYQHQLQPSKNKIFNIINNNIHSISSKIQKHKLITSKNKTIISINKKIRSIAKKIASNCPQNKIEQRLQSLEGDCSSLFGLLYLFSIEPLIHELGHALSALCLFKNAFPKINIFPFIGGAVSLKAETLTSLGEKLGTQTCEAVFAATGGSASLFASLLLFIISHKTKKNRPTLSEYSYMMGMYSLVNLGSYATSALWTTKNCLEHDFIRLWVKGGVHPLISLSFIVFLPIFIKVMMIVFDRIQAKSLKERKITFSNLHSSVAQKIIHWKKDIGWTLRPFPDIWNR